MIKSMPLNEFLFEYTERNIDNKYRPVAVGRYGIRSRDSIYSKELAKDYSKNKLIFKNTLTIGMGSVQIDIGILSTDETYSVSPAYHTYRINNINPNYLRYCLECRNQDMFARYVKKGSRQGKTIDLSRWLTYEIPVYSIEDQEKIVDKIDRVQGIIDASEKQLVKLDELVKSRFIELFDNIVKTNSKMYLEDVSEFVTVGIANSATHAYADSGIVMLRNQNIKENYLDENDLIYITPDFAQKYGSKQLIENDILVIRTGYPGVACLVPKKYEGCQTFTTLIVRLKDSTLAHAKYVCHYINSSFGKDYVDQSKVGVAQQNFGAKALAKMPIVIPPTELQNEFAAFVEQTDKSKLAVKQSLEKLETLKKSLMQQYFG